MLKIAYSQQKQWVVTAARDAIKFEFGISGSGGGHLGPRGRGTPSFSCWIESVPNPAS